MYFYVFWVAESESEVKIALVFRITSKNRTFEYVMENMLFLRD